MTEEDLIYMKNSLQGAWARVMAQEEEISDLKRSVRILEQKMGGKWQGI